MRFIQRKFEGALGSMLFKLGEKQSMKKSKLISKTVYLPKTDMTMHYLERNANECNDNGEENPTILFFHGLSDQAKNLCFFIASLEIPDNVRILVPDAIGHGENLKRAKMDANYKQPTPMDILESMNEFLDMVNVSPPCNLFGYSMGGALAYFLKYKRSDIIQKTVLLSPALECTIDETFIDDFQSGKKRHMCFESREDVKLLMRDLSTPNRKKKNPIPKFLLEPIFRDQKRNAPKGHYKKMLEFLFENMGTSFLGTDQDIDKNSPRLVIWPDNDFICSYQKGKDFFRDSPFSTFETVNDCGHMFHSDGTFILDLVKPLVSQFLLEFSIEFAQTAEGLNDPGEANSSSIDTPPKPTSTGSIGLTEASDHTASNVPSSQSPTDADLMKVTDPTLIITDPREANSSSIDTLPKPTSTDSIGLTEVSGHTTSNVPSPQSPTDADPTEVTDPSLILTDLGEAKSLPIDTLPKPNPTDSIGLSEASGHTVSNVPSSQSPNDPMEVTDPSRF
mmetsp:Transcript_20728/g.31189  ORF Transcript_20728/g.31189 Transcript_20728/m.31189 type:complete len:506 (-) Transcript_20728:286-1803(-)